MKLKYTYVDTQTRVPCNEEPMRNGPSMPAVAGLEFRFANESAWPTAVPLFFGVAPEGSDPLTPGVLAVLSDEEFVAAEAAEMGARRSKIVVTMRQARLALLHVGLLDHVAAAIAAMPAGAERREAEISWEYATEVARTHSWVVSLAAALGLSDAEVDQMFEHALTL